MKLLLIFAIVLGFENFALAQSFEVHYAVKCSRQIPIGDGKVKEYLLDYEGMIYQSRDTTINFLKPLYLQDYSSGKIMVQTSESAYIGVVLDMDTMQRINLYYSNLEKHWSFDNNSKQYYFANYKLWKMRWKLLPETREINGLQCKHAITYNGGDTTKVLFEIWYYPDIILEFGLLHLKDAPGLVVECDFPMMNISYNLKYFKTGEAVNSNIFWPIAFNKVSFVDYTKPKKVSEKDQKKSGIMNQ